MSKLSAAGESVVGNWRGPILICYSWRDHSICSFLPWQAKEEEEAAKLAQLFVTKSSQLFFFFLLAESRNYRRTQKEHLLLICPAFIFLIRIISERSTWRSQKTFSFVRTTLSLSPNDPELVHGKFHLLLYSFFPFLLPLLPAWEGESERERIKPFIRCLTAHRH